MKKVLVICGATASGKTSLAVECAKKLNTEVISADSQLVYRGLSIGTAKPTVDEMQGVKHHLIDVAEPFDSFSVCDYEQQALPILENLLNGGKTPVICGGTGFYINSLLFDFGYGNTAASAEIRVKYDNFLKENGKDALFEKLKEVDTTTAEKLHSNDTKRVIRALEIYEASGKRKSEQNDNLTPKFEYLAVAINYPRDELYERINKRVDIMFECGLVDEVQGLLRCGVDENCQCMQAIGYKEVVSGLKSGAAEAAMRETIKQNTRRYAKRQITFFKKLPNIVWLDKSEAKAEKVVELMNEQ